MCGTVATRPVVVVLTVVVLTVVVLTVVVLTVVVLAVVVLAVVVLAVVVLTVVVLAVVVLAVVVLTVVVLTVVVLTVVVLTVVVLTVVVLTVVVLAVVVLTVVVRLVIRVALVLTGQVDRRAAGFTTDLQHVAAALAGAVPTLGTLAETRTRLARQMCETATRSFERQALGHGSPLCLKAGVDTLMAQIQHLLHTAFQAVAAVRDAKAWPCAALARTRHGWASGQGFLPRYGGSRIDRRLADERALLAPGVTLVAGQLEALGTSTTTVAPRLALAANVLATRIGSTQRHLAAPPSSATNILAATLVGHSKASAKPDQRQSAHQGSRPFPRRPSTHPAPPHP